MIKHFKAHRHLIGGIALTNGLILHAPDAAVLAYRHNGEIITKYWKIPADKKTPRWLHWFGVRGLWLLWRTVAWNSRIRNFIGMATTDAAYSGKANHEAAKPSVFPFVGLVAMILLFLDIEFVIAIVNDWQTGSSALATSDLVTVGLTTAIIVYLVTRGGVWHYMGYHGAEHQAVSAFERGQTKFENVKSAWPYQTRCGAAVVSYVGLMLAVAGLILTQLSFLWTVAITLIFFSLSYEIVMVLDKYNDQYWAEFLSLPGVLLQLLVARKPSVDQSEVAFEALDELMRHSKVLEEKRPLDLDIPLD